MVDVEMPLAAAGPPRGFRLGPCVGPESGRADRPRLLSYRSSVQAMVRYHEGNYVRELKRFSVHPREDYDAEGNVVGAPDAGGESDELEGMKKFRQFEDILENGFEFRRSHFQKGFHDYCVSAVAPNVVGAADWERIGPQIIKQKQWTAAQLGKMKLAQAPRRFGKSQAVGRFAVCFGIVKAGSVQAIFSTGRRASKNLLDIMYKCLCEAGYGHTVTRYNHEELFFRPDGPLGGESKIYSYPAKAKIGRDVRGANSLFRFLFFILLRFLRLHFARGLTLSPPSPGDPAQTAQPQSDPVRSPVTTLRLSALPLGPSWPQTLGERRPAGVYPLDSGSRAKPRGWRRDAGVDSFSRCLAG